MTPLRWKHRPEKSNWGDFGQDDQLGRLNLLTPQKVLQGMAEVREGLSFCLSLPLDMPGGNVLNPRRFPPVLRPTLRDGKPNFNCTIAETYPGATDVMSDDLAVLHLQYSTQWDGLSHVGSLFDANGDGVAERVYYNGYRAGEDIIGPDAPEDAGVNGLFGPLSTSRANKLGIEHMAAKAVQGRAVLIDLHAHFGDAVTRVGYEALMRVMEADGVVVEPGDMLCLHTGFAELILRYNGQPDPAVVHDACAALDGRDGRLLDWITQSGIAVLAADNYAVERFPSDMPPGTCCSILPLHEHCLFKNGIHLGELWYLTPLAQHLRAQGRSRFLLTAPPLRLPGAVGSPATPVATV
jgi:kynurenine formamidase